MADLLEFTLQSVTANDLTIKVKNSSGISLDKTLAIEIYPPAYLVSAAVNEAAINAADNEDPPGAMRLDALVSGPATLSGSDGFPSTNCHRSSTRLSTTS